MSQLGEAYHRGDFVKKNNELAKYWYFKAGEGGSTRSLYYLAMVYKQEKDYARAILAVKPAAEKKYLPALNMLANMLYKGKGTDEDRGGAISLWEEAVKRGHVYAKRNLGHRLIGGYAGLRGVPRGLALTVAASVDAWKIALKDRSSDLLR
jgi:TPR repeat protein